MLSSGTPLQMLFIMSLSTSLLISFHWAPVGSAHAEQWATIQSVSLGPAPWTIERRRSYALLHYSRLLPMTAQSNHKKKFLQA